ncbi:MAG: DoxX family protein [Balneolales bacterium]
MKIKYEEYNDLAILLLRIGVGLVFVLAGWGKLNGIEGTQGFFADISIPLPGLMAWVVALVEFVGGLMILSGTYIRVPAPLLAVIMVVAILTVKMSQGFGAARIDLLLLLMSSALFITGSGKYSVDEKLLNKDKKKEPVAA